MPSQEQKRILVETLRQTLSGMMETSLRAARDAREGMRVGSERTRTRGERGVFNEQAYLVEAQMKQAEACGEFLRGLADLDLSPARKVRPGTLVSVLGEGRAELEWLFLVPGGMGLTVEVDGCPVQTLSPDSPLGRALLGRRPGAAVEVALPGGVRRVRLLEVL